MKCYNMSSFVIFAAVMFLGLPALAGSRDDQAANVSVYTSTVNGQVAYTYTIQNTGRNAILGFSIGFDHYTGSSQLSGNHPVKVVSPHLWGSRVITLEASPYYQVRWERINGPGGLTSGNVATGFTVVMENENPQLLNSHWTAIIGGSPTYASSELTVLAEPPEDLDATPPVISGEAEPCVLWPQQQGQ
jgi:hypothetical protein